LLIHVEIPLLGKFTNTSPFALIRVMPKDGGLSKGVQIAYGSRCHTRKPMMQKTTANKTLKQIEKEKEIHAYKISG
jgi:hypothetical protein